MHVFTPIIVQYDADLEVINLSLSTEINFMLFYVGL